jgi:hypothetical protein
VRASELQHMLPFREMAMRNVHNKLKERGHGKRLLGAVLLGESAAVCACGDCTDDIEAANAFLAKPTNLTCQSNDDCVVVLTGCYTVTRGLCGQVQLSRQAASSNEWSKLSGELRDCDESGSCAQCDAALIPGCYDGMWRWSAVAATLAVRPTYRCGRR